LDLMISLEGEEKNLKAAEADLKAEAAEVEKEKADARTRTAEDEKLLAGLNEQQKALRSEVSESPLAHYDRVMRQRKSAIAEARDAKCQACYVVVRPQIWEELKTNDQVITCSSCGRILYYDPTHEPPPPPPEPPKKKRRAAEATAESTETEAESSPEITPAP
ncbi:MAG: zinc ribbon domain-containing protein, partial [Actinomycetota bacterium]